MDDDQSKPTSNPTEDAKESIPADTLKSLPDALLHDITRLMRHANNRINCFEPQAPEAGSGPRP